MPLLDGPAAAWSARWLAVRPLPDLAAPAELRTAIGMLAGFLLYVRAKIVEGRSGDGIFASLLPRKAAAVLALTSGAAMLHRREDG